MTTTQSVTVGRTTDIKPGELAAFDVEGVRIAVANADGRFFAIDDTCTHEQCSQRLSQSRSIRFMSTRATSWSRSECR